MTKRSFLIFLCLLLIACLPLLAFLHIGLPLTHDGKDHVARIANFYQSLTEGNFVPRWAGNLNWGYGYPILEFLYPLPSYLASFFHFVGFSFIDSTKLIFVLGFLASGFTMWLWVRSSLGEEAGIFAAGLYMFAPYRFVDLYVRGALGEHVAFIFPPLILYFLFKLSKNRKDIPSFIFGSISLVLFILSHNAISLMFIPFIFAYMLLLIFSNKYKRELFLSYVSLVFLGFGISAFFWLPAYFEGKYTHRDILTAGGYANSFSSFLRFFSSSWSFEGTGKLSVEVGKLQWLVVFLSFPLIFLRLINKKRTLNMLVIISLAAFWLSLFLMTSASAFLWEKITLLQKFQFPWRFLSLVIFSAAICGAFIITALPKKAKVAGVCLGIFLLIIFNKDYWSAQGYINKTDIFFSGIYSGTTDTGESSPRWGASFMRSAPKEHLSVIGGKASIKELKRSSTKHVYEVIVSAKSQFRENTLYFPGWSIKADEKIIPIEFQDKNNQGVMTFFLPTGKHSVTVQFTETKLRFFADIISSLVIAGIILFLARKLIKKYFKR
ncbi:MAG: hypothetical protein HW400_493 [Candidatus Levybacteria bacterium]|nr:hypothetical protein [Candidatus Levybacteria bacterium]